MNRCALYHFATPPFLSRDVVYGTLPNPPPHEHNCCIGPPLPSLLLMNKVVKPTPLNMNSSASQHFPTLFYMNSFVFRSHAQPISMNRCGSWDLLQLPSPKQVCNIGPPLPANLIATFCRQSVDKQICLHDCGWEGKYLFLHKVVRRGSGDKQICLHACGGWKFLKANLCV